MVVPPSRGGRAVHGAGTHERLPLTLGSRGGAMEGRLKERLLQGGRPSLEVPTGGGSADEGRVLNNKSLQYHAYITHKPLST